ncbi:MAG: hypothetical protein AB7P34_11500 [Vicinamibacterales bacterium]
MIEDDETPRHISIAIMYDRAIRSQILFEAIALESVLDSIIAWLFCADEGKHPLLFSLIFGDGQISFSKKIVILRKLIRQIYPDLNNEFGWLPNRLDRIRMLRNKFAHAEGVLPDNPPPPERRSGATLRYFKDGKRIEEFISKDYVDDVIAESRYLQITATMLQVVVSDRATGCVHDDQLNGLRAAAALLKKRITTK